MPERTSYEPGTPSWVDLGTSDLDAARRFYGELFGWEAEDAGPPDETGGYAFFTLGGRKVAGIGPLQDDDQPTAWSVYISSDDVDALADRARGAGATVLAEPMDVMDAGRMAYFAHPAGGMFGVWQPGRHLGAELVNEPVSFSWCELHTRDAPGAKEACEAIFGWEPRDADFSGMTYTVLHVGDRGIAGMVALPPEAPSPIPSYWVTFFAVEDCDATLADLERLGGSVVMPAMDADGVGRFAMVSDPQGALFGVIANEPGTTD